MNAARQHRRLLGAIRQLAFNFRADLSAFRQRVRHAEGHVETFDKKLEPDIALRRDAGPHPIGGTETVVRCIRENELYLIGSLSHVASPSSVLLRTPM